MKPGKVLVHRDSDIVIVVAVRVINDDWCNYLVLSSQPTDPFLGTTVNIANTHIERYFKEMTL